MGQLKIRLGGRLNCNKYTIPKLKCRAAIQFWMVPGTFFVLFQTLLT